MQISVRPQLAAATATAAAAALVAVPAQAVQPSLPALPASAAVTLSAFNSPIGQLIATGELLQNYIFGDYYFGADVPTQGAGEANWPNAGFNQDGGDLLNTVLAQQKQAGYYSAVGIIPQRINDAEPIQRQLQSNWSDYINVALTGATNAAAAIDTGIWTFPQALITAAELAVSGDIPGAFEVLRQAVVTPIAQATQAVVDAGAYIVSNVFAKLAAVVGTIPQIVETFIGYAVRGLTLLAEQSVTLGTTWISDLASGDIEGAWNTAVDGLLGPSGLPGSVINLNLGAGILTNPLTDPSQDFAPSLRTAVQSALWTVQDALTTTPESAASAAAGPTAAAARAAEPGAASSPAGSATEDAAPAKAADDRSAAGSRAGRTDRADRDGRGRAAGPRDTQAAS